MLKTLIALCVVSFFFATLSCAQDESRHTYRGFPVYPPGQAYSHERYYSSSFKLQLIPKEKLESFTEQDWVSFTQEISRVAAYIESSATEHGWKVAEKKIDIEGEYFDYTFTKEIENGTRTVHVYIRAGKPLTVNDRIRLPDDFGSIAYTFTTNDAP